VYFIRHANSTYNWAYEDPDYSLDAEIDIDLVDAPLSEKGLQ